MVASIDSNWNDNSISLDRRVGEGGAARQSRPVVERSLDIGSGEDWQELIRDIASISNSGGGQIMLRVATSKPIESASGLKIGANRTLPAADGAIHPVRITTDPDAPALQPQDVSRLYPWRQKDLLNELNARLGRRALTTYDIQAVRRQHGLDERPDYVFHLPGAGRRYSPAVADWFIDEYRRDPHFFREARAADQEMLKLRRRKPR
jgi:hypothetical protein